MQAQTKSSQGLTLYIYSLVLEGLIATPKWSSEDQNVKKSEI